MWFLSKAELAVLASIDRSRASERNVLVRVSETTATSIAHRHFSFHFNDGHLIDQFHSIAAMLSELVLYREESEKTNHTIDNFNEVRK